MNNVVIECPRCLNMFMASTVKARRVGEKLWATRCRCRNVVEFDFDEHYDLCANWQLSHAFGDHDCDIAKRYNRRFVLGRSSSHWWNCSVHVESSFGFAACRSNLVD